MGKWKYSLFNRDNVHQIEVEEKSVSPTKGVTSPKGSAAKGRATPTNDKSPYDKRAGSLSLKPTKRAQKEKSAPRGMVVQIDPNHGREFSHLREDADSELRRKGAPVILKK